MNEQKLAKFIEWLSSTDEFKNKNPKEIVSELNKNSYTEDGINTISSLISQFKESIQTMNIGGKINFLITRYQQGGVYNRAAGRNKRESIRQEVDPEYLNEQLGNQNVLAKKAKAMNVEGFDESMYNMDPTQQFNRKIYRDRKAYAKEHMGDWTRRQRKAYALMDMGPNKPNLENVMPSLEHSPIPTQPRKTGKGIVSVGDAQVQNEPYKVITSTPKQKVQTIQYQRHRYNPMSWNEFATYGERALRNSGAYRNGVDLTTMQAYLENEYDRYRQQGLDYTWSNPEEGALLKTPTGWKSRYGAYNSNASNWGNVDRSGTIDFTGSKKVRQMIDPNNQLGLRDSNFDYYDTKINEDSTTAAQQYIDNYTAKRSAVGQNPSDYNTGVDMGTSFANSDVYDASFVPYELAGKTIKGAGVGALIGAGVSGAAGGFAKNYLGGAYNGAAENIMRNIPNNWVQQGRQISPALMKNGNGSYRYLIKDWGVTNPQRLGSHMSAYTRYGNMASNLPAVGEKLPAVSNRAHQLPKIAPTQSLMERMAKLTPSFGAQAGAVIGGTYSGGKAIYNLLNGNSDLDQARSRYTQFIPSYSE